MTIDRCTSCNTPVDTDKSTPTYAELSREMDKLRLALTLALDALEETGGFKSQIASIRKAFGAPRLVVVGDAPAEPANYAAVQDAVAPAMGEE